MKIVLFGSTGNSGLELVKQGLAKGHEITAIVRNPSKLNNYRNEKNLKIVTADIMKPAELVPHLKGQDCVLSALGAPGIHFFSIKLYSESMKSITKAMNEANIKRLLCITAFYTKPNDGSYPGIYTFLLRPMIGRQFADMYTMEEYLKNEANAIDYTIVRPPRLTDNALSNLEVIIKEDVYLINNGNQNQIPRANVAKFMLEESENNKFINKAVCVDLPVEKTNP